MWPSSWKLYVDDFPFFWFPSSSSRTRARAVWSLGDNGGTNHHHHCQCHHVAIGAKCHHHNRCSTMKSSEWSLSKTSLKKGNFNQHCRQPSSALLGIELMVLVPKNWTTSQRCKQFHSFVFQSTALHTAQQLNPKTKTSSSQNIHYPCSQICCAFGNVFIIGMILSEERMGRAQQKSLWQSKIVQPV